MRSIFFLYCFMFFSHIFGAYWQQSIEYQIIGKLDDNVHKFYAVSNIKYTNNSPDKLNNLYFHLYYNAFQPGSVMDVRSRNIQDPDKRVANRIFGLKDSEQGKMIIKSLKINGKITKFEVNGTILEVKLNQSIDKGVTTLIEMEWESQIPLQIRRTGRNNKEGIDYTMTQWYPKLCEYDYRGWHANPYIGREFYGVWGDFYVEITAPEKYIIAGGGDLVNGIYNSTKDKLPSKFKGNRKWKFTAKNVHDFAWAADPDYEILTHKTKEGTLIQFFHQTNMSYDTSWKQLPEILDTALIFMNNRYGKYPYKTYSIIQGGDGGMEYIRATMITGHRSLISLVGVVLHEWMHSWYQGVLATDESHYHWMDEGFTECAQLEIYNYLAQKGMIRDTFMDNPIAQAMLDQASFTQSGREEVMCKHADHFVTNTAYGMAAYNKGMVFIKQLEYIVGSKTYRKSLLDYFNKWKFKHPSPNDFLRVFEKNSKLELDWYYEYMAHTTDKIDICIDSVGTSMQGNVVFLSKKDLFPMPVDLKICYENGNCQYYHIPLDIMRGSKPLSKDWTLAKDWTWVENNYQLVLPNSYGQISSVELDQNIMTMDVNRQNNIWNPK